MAGDVDTAEKLFLAGEFQKSFDLLQELTKDEKNGRAQYLLGLFYFYGIVVEENDDKFYELMDKAWDADEALSYIFLIYPHEEDKEKCHEFYVELIKQLRKWDKEGDVFSTYQIAMLYQRGMGVKLDLEKALAWHEKAAEKGLVMAMVDAGNLYLCENMPFSNPKKGYQWFLKGAALGYHEAEVHLGDCYYCGVGVEEDLEKAEICFQRAAAHGNVEACDALGTMYIMGEGGEADAKKAISYFQKGAKRGSSSCYFKWGDCYFFGRGTDRNYPKALELYEKAWDLGYVSAAASIGMMYIIGYLGENQEEVGFQWVQKAADAGDVNGMAYLGNCYADGLGTEPDREKAKTYLTQAADGGQIEAVSKLGELALEEENWFEAVKRFREAADQGYPRAENYLGICYAEGMGVPRNLRSAEEWFRRSEAQGDPDARILMKQYLGI